MGFIFHILIFIGIYIIIAQSLNIIAGYTGILSVAHAAFYGIGAYTTALMDLKLGTPFWLNIVVAIILSAVISAIVALPALRIHDDYLVVATFGFQIIVFSIFNNWVSFTAGPLGLPGIPAISLFGFEFSEYWQFLLLVILFDIIVFFFLNKLVNSPFGLILKGIREDEIFTQSLGKNITRYKIYAFVIGGSVASVAGCLYAHFISFIDPTSFTILESIFMISIVIIGGMGNLWGSVVGAVLLVSLPEILRFTGFPSSIAANMQQILYGLLLVLFMIFRPRGFIGEHAFTKK